MGVAPDHEEVEFLVLAGSRFGQFDTYRLTAAYTLPARFAGAAVKARASFGTGAKSPGLYQLFDPVYGNAALTTAESKGYDAGLDFVWDRGGLQITAFQNKVENEIGFGLGGGPLGLFGYHFLYFSALRLAPAAEAGLICYLWPLLIVLLSGLMPGERLALGHIAGAALSFCGTALLVLGRVGPVGSGAMTGFALAGLAALTWAGYSILSRRLGAVPTASVTVFCLGTAALSALCHLALEPTLWPVGAAGWGSVLALGLGPVGLAFYVWDVGVKRGDIQLLGTLSYAAPILSTLALVVAGFAEPSPTILGAAVLVTAGAALAAWAGARTRGK